MQYSINLRFISDNRQCFLRCNIFLNCSLLFLMKKEGSALKNIRENYDPIANKNYNNSRIPSMIPIYRSREILNSPP